jgi:SNF2 family DNA or RNA helicase
MPPRYNATALSYVKVNSMKYPYKTKPYAHQREALLQGWNKQGFAYLMDMGTGKTKVALDNAGILHMYGRIDGLLVIAPAGVYAEWIDEHIAKHWPDEYSTFVLLWRGMGTVRERKRFEMMQTTQHFPIFIMNVEAFSHRGGKAMNYATQFMENRRIMVVVDESTRIKTVDSRRTENILKLGALAEYRRILTGMPVTSHPLDLFGQFEFIEPGFSGRKNYYSFKHRYAVQKKITTRLYNKRLRKMVDRDINIVVGHKNVEELQRIIKPYSYRIEKSQCLDLPPKIYKTIYISMSDKQKKIYRELSEYATAELGDDQHVTATAVIVRMMRLQQVTSGFTVDEQDNLVEITDARYNICMDTIAECSGKILIWSRFKQDIRRLAEMLRKEYGDDMVVEYHGDVSIDNRRAAIDAIQSGKARFIIGTPATGGVGITLTKVNTVIYFANDFDLEHRIQSEDRVHRIGQTMPVTYIDIVAKDSLDQKIVKALKNKLDISRTINGDNWKEWISV